MTYDVLQEAWIPVVTENGKHRKVGILEALENAQKYREISDASPMVEYSLYRFLIVFLMDALRPEDAESIEELLEEGQFDMDAIRSYVALCRREGVSFDLFDEEKPFMQSKYHEKWDKEVKSIRVLDYTAANGNNHIHFDHAEKEQVYRVEADYALRMLLAAQLFCTAGAQGYPSGVNGAPPWFALIRGENLFETLVFSMIGVDDIPISFDTVPVRWRSTSSIEPKKEVPRTSWLYGMLFPTRRILLLGDGEQGVSRVYFSQGMNYTGYEGWTDPHVTYHFSEKGRSSWKPNSEKAVWRNLSDLIDTGKKQAPQILIQYRATHRSSGYVDLMLYGVETSNASYLSLDRCDLHLPERIIGCEETVELVRGYIAVSDRISKAVKNALSDKEIPEDVRVQAVQRFYNECEAVLWAWIGQDERNQETDYMSEQKVLVEQICSAAREAVSSAINSINLRSRALLRVMNEQKFLNIELSKIIKKVSE